MYINFFNIALFQSHRSMSLPIRQLESDRMSTKDKNRGGSPVETSVFYDEREDSNTGFSNP